MHARAVEYRHTLNCAVIAREEPLEQMETLQYGKQDREILARRKRFKDVLADQFSDFHWSLGWIRRDPVTRIREISLTTVANRLFSIPELFSHYQAVMLKSKIKRKHIRPGVKTYTTVSTVVTKTLYDKNNLLKGLGLGSSMTPAVSKVIG